MWRFRFVLLMAQLLTHGQYQLTLDCKFKRAGAMDHISTVIPPLFQNFMEVQLPEHRRIILKATAVSSNPRQLCDDKNSHNLTPGQIHFKQMF